MDLPSHGGTPLRENGGRRPVSSGAMSGRMADTTTLRDYWRVLRRRRWWVLAPTVLGVALALLYSVLQPKVYSAQTEVLIQTLPGESLFGSSGDVDDENRMSTAITVLEGKDVGAVVRASGTSVDGLLGVSGASVDDTNVLTVTVEAADAGSAAALADAYAEALIEVRREQSVAGLQRQADALDAQVTDLATRIADLDVQIAQAEQTTNATVAERQAQVDTLVEGLTELQNEQIQLNVLATPTTEQQIRQQQLALEIANRQDQIAAIREDIDQLQASGSELLRQERAGLTDQQSAARLRRSQILTDATLASGGARVVEPASVPGSPDRPRPVSNALLGLFAGLIIGMAAAFLREYFDDSISVPADLSKVDGDLPLLAVVPSVVTKHGRAFGIAQPGSSAIEAFRTLRTNVQFLSVDRELRIIEVVSSQPGEGKTTVACNLAVALSQSGSRVALVDGDLRAPRVHRLFAVDPSTGLSNNLVGDSLDLTIQPITEHLAVVPAGPIPPNPSELLSSKRMGAVLDELRLRFDYVIIDSAPILAVADGLSIAQFADGVILIARSGTTAASPLNRALSALVQVSAPVVGIVLNRVRPRDGVSDGYGYTYGTAYGARSAAPEMHAPSATASQ